MQNHFVDDSTFWKLVIHTKHGGALAHDLIKGTLITYLSKFIKTLSDGMDCSMNDSL